MELEGKGERWARGWGGEGSGLMKGRVEVGSGLREETRGRGGGRSGGSKAAYRRPRLKGTGEIKGEIRRIKRA